MFVILENQAVNIRNIERVVASYDPVDENYKVEAIAVFTMATGEKYAKDFLVATCGSHQEAMEHLKEYMEELNKKIKGE